MYEYSNSVVSYLDILGFKKLIESRTSAEKIVEILRSFKQALDPQEMILKVKPHVKVILFSDLALRVINIDKLIKGFEKWPMEFAFIILEIFALARIQIMLINEGLLIRGGITIGEICTGEDDDEPFAFGPAFVAAYELEQKFAVFPRIVVDPRLLEIAQRSFRDFFNDYYQDWKDLLNVHLLFDLDGIWRVNYLGCLMISNLDRKGILLAHKDLINNGMGEYKGISREASKYSWLALYHNTFINTLSEDQLIANELNRKELLIPLDSQGLLQ